MRDGSLDLEQLFTAEPLDREIRQLSSETGVRVTELLAVLRKRSAPRVRIGPHCDDPYECEYKETCWTGMPEQQRAGRGCVLVYTLVLLLSRGHAAALTAG